ncbi:MAG: serine/threonine-protein kinase [Myxococcota bacterium]|nr:serine/threonine-protein kinase [Myxococcota bacterium]
MSDVDRHHYIGLVLGGQYEVVKPIGAGGMGQVYQGRQLSTDGRVAIKLMSTQDRTKKTIERFKYEAETTAQLTHPNTVRILDFGSDKDIFYLVMEYLSGTDLTRFLRPDGQSDAFVSHVLFQVVCSLSEAHSRGVVHRDIKPNNIMLLHHVGHPSFVKVIDFGIARAIGGPGHGTMGILGTIGYIAPEQVDGEAQPDARTDLYALGCVAYELLTGRLPFDGITHKSAPIEVLEAHKTGQPRHVLQVRPETDPELAPLIMSLLARDPDARPQSVGELVVPLHRIRSRCSAGVAYAIDVDQPIFNERRAFTHEDVVYDEQFSQSVDDPTLADGLGRLGFVRTGSIAHDSAPPQVTVTSAPPASAIPPPPAAFDRQETGLIPEGSMRSQSDDDEWALGDGTPLLSEVEKGTSDSPQSSSKAGLAFLAGCVVTVLVWLFLGRGT